MAAPATVSTASCTIAPSASASTVSSSRRAAVRRGPKNDPMGLSAATGTSPYDARMGTYVGAASLLDADDSKVADVRVTLSAADVDHWFGTVQGLDERLQLHGLDVTVELPAGVRGQARLVIDITGDAPLVRLVGTGTSPV